VCEFTITTNGTAERNRTVWSDPKSDHTVALSKTKDKLQSPQRSMAYVATQRRVRT